MGIALLVLTLDGVMFDTEDVHRRACNVAFRAKNIDRRWSTSDFRKAAAHRSAALAITMAQGISSRDMNGLLQEKQDAFHTLVLDGAVSLIGECMSLAEQSLAAGCKLAIVTDLPARTTTALLEQAYGDAVNDVFSVVASGVDIQNALGNGPHQLAMRTVGVEAEDAAAIESSAAGLKAARAAGIWTFFTSMQDTQAGQFGHGNQRPAHLRDWRDMQVRESTQQAGRCPTLSFDMLCMLKQQHPEGLPPSEVPMPARRFA